MNLKKYIPDGKYYQQMAEVRQVGVARVLLDAVEIKRDEFREIKETRPQLCPEDLKKDIVFQTGAIWALNWVLKLPEETRNILSKLPDN